MSEERSWERALLPKQRGSKQLKHMKNHLGGLEGIEALSRGSLGDMEMPSSYKEVKANCLEVAALPLPRYPGTASTAALSCPVVAGRGPRLPPTCPPGAIRLPADRQQPACPGLPGAC